ncbi:hypothetical protein ABZ392_33885 [Streptomyces sp. NPDC005885]|uniref:hypothetical protein n=1 Tax=Streptomyces sp. NPDC005885 TaxID=3157079 RepID=UPI0033FA2CE8
MSQPSPVRAGDARARTHIKALIDEMKHQATNTPGPAQMFLSGMLSGLAAAVEILNGGTAEGSMETIVTRLSSAIGQAYLDGQLPSQPPTVNSEHQLSREQEIRGVQAQLASDLHHALGWSVNGAEHQGRKSWGDWWAELVAEVRILKRVDDHREERYGRIVAEDGPDADRRTARRANVSAQLDRLGRRGILGTSTAELLRNQVEAEMREHDTARTVAAGNLRHVKTLVPELEQAQAAIARVRALLPDDPADDFRAPVIVPGGLRAILDDALSRAESPRSLACGLCYEEQGEEVHPHPGCPIGRSQRPS